MRIKDRTIDPGLLLKIFLKSLKSSHYYVFKWDRKKKLYIYICDLRVKKTKYMMGAIHSTKTSGNFGPKLNGSVGSSRKGSKKLVHLLRWTSLPGRTFLNFGWMDRARCYYRVLYWSRPWKKFKFGSSDTKPQTTNR